MRPFYTLTRAVQARSTRYFGALLLTTSFSAQAQTGGVGIGTTAPTQALDVNGNLRVRGLTATDTRLVTTQPDGTLGLSGAIQTYTSNPSGTPTAVSSQALAQGVGVATYGNYLYAAKRTSPGQVLVFDLTNPAAPAATGTPAATGSTFLGQMLVVGSYLYLADANNNNVRVYSLATPTAPSLVTTLGTGAGAFGLAKVGSYVYVSAYNSATTTILNVTNPAAPVAAGTFTLPNACGGLVADGAGLLYASTLANPGAIYTYNVANPLAPVAVGAPVAATNRPSGMALSNGYLYVGNEGADLVQVYSLATPTAPVSTGTIAAGDQPDGLTIRGSYLYVASYGANLQVFNLGPANALGFNGSGQLTSVPAPVATASNGLTTTNTNVMLGGTLSQATTIAQAGNAFSFTGGNVGIGTSPSATLHVGGTASTVRLEGLSGTGTRVVTADATGNLGTTPVADAQTLSVSGGNLTISNGNSVTLASLGDNLGNHTATQALNLGANRLVGNGGTTGLAISSAGNVGIGMSSGAATQKLDVRGNLRLGDDGGNVGTGQAIEWVGPGVSTDPVGIYRVNTAADQSQLRVVVGDAADANDKFVVGRTSGSTEGSIPAGTFTPNFTVQSDGNVGIGNTSPVAPLQVNGIALLGGSTPPNTTNATGVSWNAVSPGNGESEFFNYRGLGSGGFRFFSINSTGAPAVGAGGNQIAFINSAGAYSALSDRRVKTNITALGQGLRTVMALRPVSYDFHTSRQLKDGVVTFLPDDKPVHALGFVAQDLYKVVPEAVEKPKDERTELYTVSYTTLVPVLTQAIQEQQAQIEALKAENAALKARTASAEAQATATTEAFEARLRRLEASSAQAQR